MDTKINEPTVTVTTKKPKKKIDLSLYHSTCCHRKVVFIQTAAKDIAGYYCDRCKLKTWPIKK